MNGLWYEPARINRLRKATITALEELDSIRIDDPLASDVRHAVSNLRITLETVWMPAIDRIFNSRSMVEWRQVYGDHGPMRIVNGLRRGHRDPHDVRLRQFDLVMKELGACTDSLYPEQLLARFDALVAWIGENGISVSAERLGSLLTLLEQLDWMEANGLMAGNPMRRRSIAAIFGVYLTTVLGFGAVIGSETEAISREDHWLTRSPAMVRLITEYPDLIDGAALAEVARVMLTFNAQLGPWSTNPHQIDRWNEVSALLAIISQSPDLIERVIDDNTLVALATDHHLDPAAVEEFLSSALTRDPRNGLVRLGRLIEIAGDDDLTPGARRGIARGLAVLLGPIAPFLDQRLEVTVSLDGDLVRIGTYEDVARVVGQLLDEETSQMILGLAIAAMRQDRMREVEHLLSDGFQGTADGAVLTVSAALGDITRVLKLIDVSRHQRDELLALQHAMARSHARTVTDLLGVTASATPGLGRAIATTASIAVRIALDGESRQVGGEHIHETWAFNSILLLLKLPATSPDARRALGLDSVPDATWREIRELISIGENEPHRRPEVIPRLRGLGVEFWELDNYINIVKSVSGEIMLE